MSAPATFEEMLQRADWSEVPRKSQNGGHAIWRCPAECGQHQVSIPRQHGRNGSFDPRSPIARRIARCATDLDKKRQTALALQAIANPTPDPEPTPEPQPDQQPAREEEPMAATPTPAPARPIDVVIVDGREAEVIAREPATVPHPRSKKPMLVAGVEKILLADGREVYSCADCDHIHPNPFSVRNHRRTHKATPTRRSATPAPAGPPAMLLVDGAVVGTASRKPAVMPRMRDQVMVATDKVDEVVLVDGRTIYACTDPGCIYTNSVAQGVWVHHGRMHSAKGIARRTEQASRKAAVRAPRPVAQRRPEPAPAETPAVDAVSKPTALPDRLDAAVTRLFELALEVNALAREMTKLSEEVAQRGEEDGELAEKARRYDQLKALMGN